VWCSRAGCRRRTAGGDSVGVKDIVETRHGNRIRLAALQGPCRNEDAAIIRELRSHGAVLLGKTVTTAFAYRTPGPTRNPRNLEHRRGQLERLGGQPVAAGMVALHHREQTRGSILRRRRLRRHRVQADSMTYAYGRRASSRASLDTLGFYTHTPADMLELWKATAKTYRPRRAIFIRRPSRFPECDRKCLNAFRNPSRCWRRSGITIKSINIADELKKSWLKRAILSKLTKARDSMSHA